MSEPDPLDYGPVTAHALGRRWWLKFGLISFAGVACVAVVMLMFLRLVVAMAGRAPCSNNLRQIGLAITMYSRENEGQYPSEAGALISTQGLSAEVFTCPSSDDTKLQASPPTQAATLLSGGHCSYVYIGAGMTSAAGSDEVVAFEFPRNHSKKGGNVLWGDGHVTWEGFETLVQLVPELEAGRNPPMIGPLTPGQAKKLYEQKWVPKLASIKNGTWAASLPRPATRPSAEANESSGN